MSKNSPSARVHRVLVILRKEYIYRKYGPLIGPKEQHQPNPRWENIMHETWIKSMEYHNIPKDEWQPFYDWYCETYPQGDRMISAAYEEWKNSHHIFKDN